MGGCGGGGKRVSTCFKHIFVTCVALDHVHAPLRIKTARED